MPGVDRKKLALKGRQMCRKIAEGEADGKKRQRLLGAVCGPKWVNRVLQSKATDSVADTTTMKKQSQMSRSRAAAKNPVINAAMFAQIKQQYGDHYEQGLLFTPMPESDQIYGGDEVGMNPSGHTGKRVVCSLLRRQIVVVTDGEGGKATFWVTFFFWTRADGQFVIPPCVVHQGAQMSDYFRLNLPQDWCVHCSPSGYMDRDGWLKVARHFKRYCGPTRPLYLYFDGHDSHWDPDALDEWLDDNIFPTFFKAHGSEDDNMNDNGPNAAFHSEFDDATSDWGETYPGTKDAVPFVNERLVVAWKNLKARGGPIAVNAAAITGIYPFNPNSANHTDGLDLVARKFQISKPWVDNTYTPNFDEKEGTKYQLITARRAAPNRGILVRAKAAEAVLESHVCPAQKLNQVYEQHKRAKKNKVDATPSRMNPDSTKGVIVTREIAAEARVVDEARRAEKKKKKKTKESSEKKRVVKRDAMSMALEEVVSLVNTKRAAGEMDWDKLVGRGGVTTLEKVKLALQKIGDGTKFTKGKKKDDLIAIFREKFNDCEGKF